MAHLSESFDSTSNNKKRRTESLRRKDGYAIRAIHPLHKEAVAKGSKRLISSKPKILTH